MDFIAQIGSTVLLWMTVSSLVLRYFGIFVEEQGFDFHAPTLMAWYVFGGSGLVCIFLHIIIAILLHKGVHENQAAYVIAWLMYVTVSWSCAAITFNHLCGNPSWDKAVLAGFMGPIFTLGPLGFLFCIKVTKEWDFTLCSVYAEEELPEQEAVYYGDNFDYKTYLQLPRVNVIRRIHHVPMPKRMCRKASNRIPRLPLKISKFGWKK